MGLYRTRPQQTITESLVLFEGAWVLNTAKLNRLNLVNSFALSIKLGSADQHPPADGSDHLWAQEASRRGEARRASLAVCSVGP